MTFRPFVAMIISLPIPASAQGFVPPPPPPPPAIASAAPTPTIVHEPPAPAEIDGRPATELTPSELRAFLQSKVRTVHQDSEQVEILRVAPGYPATLQFDELPGDLIVGDPNLLTAAKLGRLVVLTAKAASGDTSLKLTLSGNRLLNFHVFIDESFATADSTIRVVVDPTGEPVTSSANRNAPPDLRTIATIIRNFDALEQEGALDRRFVAREPVFRRSKTGPFEYLQWFVFANGAATLTFQLSNRTTSRQRLDSARLRLQIGQQRFTPAMVSFSQPVLPPGASASGFALFNRPSFVLDQPFELIFQ